MLDRPLQPVVLLQKDKKERKMVGGQLSREMEVNVPPCEAWDLYGTRPLAKLVDEDFSHIHKIEVSYGGGGVGTILNITFVPAGTYHKH